jgi:hypothetical protein
VYLNLNGDGLALRQMGSLFFIFPTSSFSLPGVDSHQSTQVNFVQVS